MEENNEEMEKNEETSQEERNTQKSEEKSMQQTSKGSSVKKEAIKKLGKELSKKIAEKAGANSLLAALGPVLVWAAIIIVIIIIVVGIIMFFMTMPGMVTEKLKIFALDFAKRIAVYYGGDSTELNLEDSQIYEVLDYLEQMGYDLKGYGFLNKNANESDPNYDERAGVIRDPDTGLITKAYSDIIAVYLISENYTYTIANFNQVGSPNGILNTILTNVPGASIIYNVLDRLAFMDTTEKYGRGLISIYFENGDEYEPAEIDKIFGTDISWSAVKLDPEANTLAIRRGWGGEYFSYNIEGWTGRYGMPLEFLLAVQLATMKPDLSYDMASTFNTRVRIQLKPADGEMVVAYKTTDDKYVTYADYNKALSGMEGRNLFSAIISAIDNWGVNVDEANDLFAVGMEHVHTEDDPCVFDEDGNLTTLSEACKQHIKDVLKELSTANVYDFKTYLPYIAKVTDHWYRDVYFKLTAGEASSTELIANDAEYEALTNERWTLYETYETGEKAGEYKLYKFDSSKTDGYGELYKGTQEEADKEGIKVVKKPVETYISDLAADDIVKLNDDGSWSAYEEESTNTENFEKVYPSEEESTIKGRIYQKTSVYNDLVQKDDGVRTVTNLKIKKMFLENQYFSYDGSQKTADIIKAARDQLGMDYGPVSKTNLDKTITATIEGKTQTYKVEDLTSTVSITQDSLAAFSMLENTHTLDADFIYKDFKELIVELGYFTREELSEGTPKLLQWLIPEISSGGFPKRSLDKKENEFGTQAHSKEDYKANIKNTLMALQEKLDADRESGAIIEEAGGVPDSEFSNEATSAKLNVPQIKENKYATDLNNKDVITKFKGKNKVTEYAATDKIILAQNGVSNVTDARRNDIEILPEEGDGYTHKIKMGSVEYIQYYQFRGSYAKSSYYSVPHGKNVIFSAQGCMATSSINVLTGYGVDISPNDLVGKTFGGYSEFFNEYGVEVEEYNGLTKDGYKDLIIEAFKEGKPVVTLMKGSHWYSGGHSVPLLGIDSKGNLITADPGGSAADKRVYPGRSGDPLDEACGCMYKLVIPKEAPTGAKSSGGAYEGYEGNEAVVSPVTGILLDYGTYDETDVSNGYRVNSDKKDKTDAVGYAKILVLNDEITSQIVSVGDDETGAKIKINEDNVKTLEGLNDDLTNDEREVLGYDIFTEDYENGGIAGYLIYIDGFKCELPGTKSEEGEVTAAGEELSMEYFKENAAKKGAIECQYKNTLYEPDQVFNLLNEKIEERQKAKAEAKNIAASLYLAENISIDDEEHDEILIIKEGTIIGRTLTNEELVVDYRGEEYEAPAETVEGEEADSEDTTEVQGNYLRIIMRDLDDTVVENVEDYMKLDDGSVKHSENDWELFYWLPFESGGIDQEGNGPESQGSCSSGETAVGIIQWTVLTSDNMNNIADQFIPGCLEYDPTLCAPLKAYESWSDEDFWNDWNSGAKQFQATLKQICNTDRDGFLAAQMDVAKKQYLDPLIEEYPWLAERPSCVQGEIMHLNVWAPVIVDRMNLSNYKNSTDEQIILKVRNMIANTSSTAHDATGDESTGRAYNEPQIALEILSGRATLSDIETWVRTKDASVFDFNFK